MLREHLRDGKFYEKACLLLTKEVNAAIEGAFSAGADEVLVNDSHMGASNIDIEQLDERASLVTGSGKRDTWAAGIDKTYDGVVFIGFHAMEGTEDAVFDHTMSLTVGIICG